MLVRKGLYLATHWKLTVLPSLLARLGSHFPTDSGKGRINIGWGGEENGSSRRGGLP